ncbi:MAG: hypothetical protein WED81_04900 [Rhodothermales bacterium]
MESPPTFGRHRDALLQNLGSIFAVAQVLTPNAEEAVGLVEESYRRALASPERFSSAEEARLHLMQLLVEIRNEALASAGDATLDVPVATDANEMELTDFRRRLAMRLVDLALPTAFATLSPEHRLLLMLCDVERVDCESAGRIIGIDPLLSCRRAEEARIALHRALVANSTSVEKELLETSLQGAWKREALQRMVESELITLPPTLQPSIRAIAKAVAGESGDKLEQGISENGGLEPASPWKRLAQRSGAVVAIIATAGLLGYGFTYIMQREPDVSLISLSARHADAVEATFETSRPEQAERFIFDRLGERVTVPTIQRATLHGVSVGDVTEGAEVPVLIYGEGDQTIVVYVYSYAFLDRHDKHLVLERDILRQIEDEGNFDLHDLGEDKVLIWRNRDDIYIAITSGDAEELRQRITFPS